MAKNDPVSSLRFGWFVEDASDLARFPLGEPLPFMGPCHDSVTGEPIPDAEMRALVERTFARARRVSFTAPKEQADEPRDP
jgi:hypothetical protein